MGLSLRLVFFILRRLFIVRQGGRVDVMSWGTAATSFGDEAVVGVVDGICVGGGGSVETRRHLIRQRRQS